MTKDINLTVELMTDKRSLPGGDAVAEVAEEPKWRWSRRFVSLYLSALLPTIVQLHPSPLLVEAIIRSPNLSYWLIFPSILSLAQPVKAEGPSVAQQVELR